MFVSKCPWHTAQKSETNLLLVTFAMTILQVGWVQIDTQKLLVVMVAKS
jgi:hypothetical protein